MVLSRKRFLVLAGFCAADLVLETQKRGAGALIAAASSRLFNNSPASWTPDQTVDISRDPSLSEVYAFFAPSIRDYIANIPVVTSDKAQTAYAHYEPEKKCVYVAFSCDFFNKAEDSEYWREYYSRTPYSMSPGQPVFPEDFRRQLFVHELLHISQLYSRIDPQRFSRTTESWYRDEAFGRPVVDRGRGVPLSNRVKYILWWNLYGQGGHPDVPEDSEWKSTDYCARYRYSRRGVEEFAYVGETILVPESTESRLDRVRDVSEEMLGFYETIIDPKILALRA